MCCALFPGYDKWVIIKESFLQLCLNSTAIHRLHWTLVMLIVDENHIYRRYENEDETYSLVDSKL